MLRSKSYECTLLMISTVHSPHSLYYRGITNDYKKLYIPATSQVLNICCFQRMLSETGVGVGGGVVLRCSQPCEERQPHLHTAGQAGQGDEKVSKRWYILVIVLLYIGLIISFCLNLALLLRKHPSIHQLSTFSTANVEGQLLTIKLPEVVVKKNFVGLKPLQYPFKNL